MMKTRLNFLSILATALLLFSVSCNKDQTMVIASPSTPVNLTASHQTIVLTQPNGTENAVDISWNKADFGYAAAINYTLQVSFKDSSFRRFASVGMGSATSTSFTVTDLNTLLLGAKYLADQASDVQIRVLAEVADSLYVFSDTLTLNITPYVAKRVINYPALYVPGSYQGWDFATDAIARLFSIDNDGMYKGYVNLTADTNTFKFTNQLDWNGDQYASGGKGLLATSGSDLQVLGEGYYLIKADTKKLTWSATLENWGIIGDAAEGWDDANEVMFDFDQQSQLLTKTIDLKEGGLKFRANHNWDLNIGDGFVYGASDNMMITKAGTYLITLDLRVPDEPVVTMTLQ